MKKTKKVVSPFARLSFVVFIFALLLLFAADSSYTAADYINSGICREFRSIMADFGEIFPFSLFEVLAFCLPVVIFLVFYTGIKRFAYGRSRLRFLINLVALVLLIYSGHTIALGIGYKTTPIAEKMHLPDTEVTVGRLSEAMISLRDEVNSLADSVPRDSRGVFEPEYTYTQVSDRILSSYSVLEEEYDLPRNFKSTVKGVRAGKLMSYLGITGIYTYITGEANLNTAYPAYDRIFTAAHEMSHQRGILRENEANFIAYLLTSSSDDDNLRYSAALSMYGYISSALYRTSPDAYFAIAEGLSDLAIKDIRTSNEITKKYADTVIADISEWVNDLYLESNGTDGVISYSQVVELTLAYFEMKK